jgi:hypothetical protein
MAGKYEGKQGAFSAALREFQEKALQAAEGVFQGVMLKLSTDIITKSPVGDPENWKVNQVATQYNAAVRDANSALRDDPSNLTKAGRLKAGRKINDGMDIYRPAGYVGGRFRANWQFQSGAPASGEIDAVDPSGAKTIGTIQAGTQSLKLGETAYLVNNLEYAIPLEYGHSKQSPEGMVGITVARYQLIVAAAIDENKV